MHILSTFLEQVKLALSIELKIRAALECMRGALSGEEGVHFKDFWEIRRLCLAFFKEHLAPKVRAQLWSEYVEISLESKRLKEILDEQAAFVGEQIELAIRALETDVENRPVEISSVYSETQAALVCLGALSARVQALRQEVIQTPMRASIKAKFLARLSVCGDRVFPQRKEWIQKISAQFAEEVESFVAVRFQQESSHYALREEVKRLQGIAKSLTLSSSVFTKTRLKLGECWDRLHEQESAHEQELTLELTREKLKAQEVLLCAQAVRELVQASADMPEEKLREHLEALEQKLSVLSLVEKSRFERQLKQLSDTVQAKKLSALLSLEDVQAVLELKEILQMRKTRRQELKGQLEGYRKLLGGSSLDFARALFYQELIEAEKSTLETMQASIEEIEERLEEMAY